MANQHLALTAAKIKAVTLRPYFAAALNALIHVEKPGIGTMAVDPFYRLYYDPVIFDKWNIEHLAGVILHEIGHLLRAHHARARALGATVDPALANICEDMELNDDLVLERLSLPEFIPKSGKPLLPATFGLKEGELFESYYQQLIEQADKQQKGNKGQTGAGNGMCGSGAHGQPMPWDEPGGGPNPGPNDTPSVNQSEAELISRQVAKDIKDASEKNGNQAGNVAAGWKRWANDKLKTKVNYNAWIRAAIRGGYAEAQGRSDYSYRRPNRRTMAFAPIVMPGVAGPRPRVGIGIDTSGSMSEKQLSQALAECKGALNAAGASTGLWVTACDTAATPVKHVFNVDSIPLVGGGGTDVGVAIDKLLEVKPRLGVIILFTDCETPWPPVKPPVPIVIIKIAGSGQPPPWDCRLVEIDLGEF